MMKVLGEFAIPLDGEAETEIKPKKEVWPSKLEPEAFHGVAGEFIRAVESQTESDNAALLVQFLVAFGNLIGRSAFIRIGASKHYANLFVTLVGNSSHGRKGTALDLVKLVLSQVDTKWWAECRIFGLGSGEGLVSCVQDYDPPSAEELKKKPNLKIEKPRDKRGMVIEGEFGLTLKVFQREGGTLSPQVRSAWDSGDLRVTTKNDSLKSTGAHISIIGHITSVEVKQLLSVSDLFNGIGNRVMWICTKRSKLVPMPQLPPPATIAALVTKVSAASDFAKRTGEIRLSAESEANYREIYASLTRERPGLLGVLTARAAPIILRLSMIYALLDQSGEIQPKHLNAAIAVWQYAEQSVEVIFGKHTGDKVADKLLGAITKAANGLTQTEILEDVFGGNLKAERLTTALELLSGYGLITSKKEMSGIRPVTRWSQPSTSDEFYESSEQNSLNSYLVSPNMGGDAHVS